MLKCVLPAIMNWIFTSPLTVFFGRDTHRNCDFHEQNLLPKYISLYDLPQELQGGQQHFIELVSLFLAIHMVVCF